MGSVTGLAHNISNAALNTLARLWINKHDSLSRHYIQEVDEVSTQPWNPTTSAGMENNRGGRKVFQADRPQAHTAVEVS